LGVRRKCIILGGTFAGEKSYYEKYDAGNLHLPSIIDAAWKYILGTVA
jgi:hypothetical protein